MPNFVVGGIDVTAEPTFEGFRRKLREGLREEEAHAPNVRIAAEPRITRAFRREMESIVKEATAGLTVEIEGTAGLRRDFRKEMQRVVTEATTGLTTDIEATPALSNTFRPELKKLLAGERGAGGLTVDIEATPALGRGFKTELRKLVQEASAGVRMDVEVKASLPRGFRTALKAQLVKSTKGVAPAIEFKPSLRRGFRKELIELVKTGSKGVTFDIEAVPRLSRTFRSQLRALAKEASGTFPVSVDLVPQNPREIRFKLQEALRRATERPLSVKVFLDVDVAGFRRNVEESVARIDATKPNVNVGADLTKFRRQLAEGVATAVGAVKGLATIPVSLSTTAFRKGLAFVENGLARVRRLAVLAATGFGLVAAAVGAVGVAGVKSASDFEVQRLSLDKLLGSATLGEKLFTGLLAQAKATPFQLPDLAPLLKQFVVIRNTLNQPDVFGTKDLLSSVQTVTDLGAELGVTGANIQKVGLALSKIAGRGKLTALELRSINQNLPGFSAIQAIAKDLGITVPEAFKKITAGEVNSATAITSILKGMKEFPGAANFAAISVQKTFKAALSNFPDIVRIGFFEAFADQLPALTKLLQADGPLAKAAEQGAAAVAKPFTAFAVQLADFLKSAATTLGPIFDAVVKVVGHVFEIIQPLLPAVETLFTVLRIAVEPLVPALSTLALFIGTNLTQALFASIGPLTQLSESFGEIIVAVAQLLPAGLKLLPWIAQLVSFFVHGLVPAARTLLPVFNKLVPVIGAFLFALAQGLHSLGPAIGGILTHLIVGLTSIVAALTPAVGPLIAAFRFMLNALEPVLPVLGEMIGLIGVGLVKVIVAVLPPLSKLVQAIAPALLPIAEALVPLAAGIGQFFAALLNALRPIMPILGRAIALLGPILTSVLTALAPVFAPLAKALGQIVTVIAQVLSKLGGPLFKTIAILFVGLVKAAEPLVPAVLGLVKAFLPLVVVFQTFMAGARAKAVIDLFSTLATVVAELVVAVTPLVVQFVQFLIPIFKAILPIVLKVVEAFLPLISAFGEALLPVLGDFVKALGPLLTDLLPVIVTLIDAWSQALLPLLPSLTELAIALMPVLLIGMQEFLIIMQVLLPVLLPIVKLWARFTIVIAKVVGVIASALAVFIRFTAVVIRLGTKAVSALVHGFGAALGVVLRFVQRVPGYLAALPGQAQRALVRFGPTVLRAIGGALEAAGRGILTGVDAVVDFFLKLPGRVFRALVRFGPTVLKAFANAGQEWVAFLVTLPINLIAALVNFGPVFYRFMFRVWKRVGEIILVGIAAAVVLISRLPGMAIRAIAHFGPGLVRAIASGLDALGRAVAAGLGAVVDFFRKLPGRTVRALGNLGGILGRFFTRAWGAAKTAVKTGIDAAIQFVKDIPHRILLVGDALFHAGKTVGGKIVHGIVAGFKAAVGLGKDLLLGIEHGIAHVINGLIDKINDKLPNRIGPIKVPHIPHIPELAGGGLFSVPTLALIAEGGPELVLPLTDKKRMLELLRQAGVIDAAQSALNTQQLRLPPVVAPPAGARGVGLNLAADPERGKKFTKGTADSVADLGTKLTAATDPGLNRWVGSVGTHITKIGHRFTQFGVDTRRDLSSTMTSLTGIATLGSGEVVGALRSGLTTGTTTVRGIVRGYSRALATALNPVLEAIGQPKIAKFRRGGVNDPRIVPDGSYNVHVFGERGTKGEAYIPFDPSLRSSSRAIADETVRRLGGRAQWFRGGGITGDTVGLDPEFFRRLDRWSNAVGLGYHVDSGYRSIAEQTRLYQRYLAGVPGQAKAAPPGHSMHNFGLASDGNRWRARRPGDFGLRYPMGFEPWHVEPVEARQWAGMADRHIAIVPLPKSPSAGAFGQLSITGKKAMDFTYLQALAFAGRQVTTQAPGTLPFTGGSASETAAANWIRQAMKITGVGSYWLDRLLTLTQRESGWDPKAINLWDANAKAGHPSMGIAQMIRSTFLAHALPGMTDIFNPVDNLVSVIRYILDRFGDILNVQQANPSLPPRGFADGAIVHREQIARIAERNKPEVIIPLTNPVRAMALAEASGVAGMVRRRDGGYSGPKTVVEKVEVNVTPPAAQSPDAYAASMSNRLPYAVAAAIERAMP